SNAPGEPLRAGKASFVGLQRRQPNVENHQMRSAHFTIAGLMGAVLVAAIGFAALRNASETWAGVIFLLTCAVLCLSIVGVVCRGLPARAGWLGFALFGWGSLILGFWSADFLPGLPSRWLAEMVCEKFSAPAPPMNGLQSAPVGFSNRAFFIFGGFGGNV